MGRFRMWPRWGDETETPYQRCGIFGMVFSIAGVFAGMPAAFTFLAMALYGTGALRDWLLGFLFLAFGLWGLWQMMFGARSRPGRIYKDKLG